MFYVCVGLAADPVSWLGRYLHAISNILARLHVENAKDPSLSYGNPLACFKVMRRETPSMSPRLADTAVRDTECEPHWDSKSETTDTEDDHLLRTLNMERTKVEAGSGISLSVRVFRPDGNVCRKDLTMVLVHQYSVLGGCQELLGGMACRLSAKGFTTITFDMRGVGESTGKPSLTGTSEVQDVVAVCQWAAQHCSALSIVLVGSSAGKTSQRKPASLLFLFLPLHSFLISTVALYGYIWEAVIRSK